MIHDKIYYKTDWISTNRYPFTMFGGDSISVVVAMKIKGGVVVAADSQITIGGVSKTSVCKSNYKVWHPSEYLNIVIGSVGSVRELNLIKTTKDLISEVRYIKNDVDFEYIVSDFVPKMRETLIEKKAIEDEKKPFRFSNSYIIAVADKIYQIHHDCSVMEIDQYTAIGSGANEALANMYSSSDKHSSNSSVSDNASSGSCNDSVVTAVRAAINNYIYDGGPIIVGSIIELKMSVINN